MPRLSLPTQLKSLKSYEVLLTQTQEDELLDFYTGRITWFHAIKEKYTQNIANVLNMFMDENPYSDHNWKKREPTRYYNEPFIWLANDDEITEYFKIGSLIHDLTIIAKTFEWENIKDWLFELEKFQRGISSDQTNLLQLEANRFNYAKKKFEDENKEWIEEQKVLQIHKERHPTAFMLFQQYEANNNLQLDCIHCKSSLKTEINTIEKFRLTEHITNHLSNEQMIQRIENGIGVSYFTTTCKLCFDQCERLQVEPKQTIECTVLKTKNTEQICPDCEFTSTHKSLFILHFSEPQHLKAMKIKELHCTACGVQSRTQVEHNNHIATKKHLNTVNGTKEYHCETCDYTTLLKHLFEQHNNTKKHLAKI